jgi:hypothetical protein
MQQRMTVILIAVLVIVGLSASAFAQSTMIPFDKRNPSGKYASIQLAQAFDGAMAKQCWGNAIFPNDVVSAKWQRIYDQGKPAGWQRQVMFRNLTSFSSPDDMLAKATGLRDEIENVLEEIGGREAELPADPQADVVMQTTWQIARDGSWQVLPQSMAKK